MSEPLEYESQLRLEDESLGSGEIDVVESPDRRDGKIYDCDADLKLATEVALVTGRPLLLEGDPGSGKSSFAAYVARNLNWRYYEHTVTSSTRAESLLWQFDVVRRLADAQARAGQTNPDPLNDLDYVEPGPLWWVFDADSARQRGYRELQARAGARAALKPRRDAADPNSAINGPRDPRRAVLLIDELDKADPEVPNALLVPLGSRKFWVSDIGIEVAWQGGLPRPTGGSPPSRVELGREQLSRLLVVVTTNQERQLPRAFLRRCIVHHLNPPSPQRLIQIAKLHFGGAESLARLDGNLTRTTTLAHKIDELRKQAEQEARRPPSTAEFLDAVRACLALNIPVDDQRAAWRVLQQATLFKQRNEADP